MEQVLYKLPDGWEWHKLKDLTTKIGSGATPKGGEKAYKSSGISLIRSLNVHDCFFKEKKLAFIDDEQANGLKNVVVESGDVLLNITGASIARCCIVPDEFLPARVNQHVTIIRPIENVDSKFLNYLIVNPKFKAQLLWQGAGGATRQALTKAMVEELDIPLPSLSEQKRIIEKLDALLTRIDTAIEHLQESVTLADALFSSALNRVFNPSESKAISDNDYRLPEGWNWMAVKELSKKIQYGHTAKAADKGNAQFLRITDIQDNNIVWTGVPFVELSEKEIEKYALAENDLVFARSGATAGKSILIKEPPNNSIFASYLIRIVPNREIIQPEYLGLFFRSPAYWDIVRTNAAGAAQPNINGTKLSEFKVPTPKLEIQKEIIDEMSKLSARVTDLKKELRNKLTFFEMTKSSILDSAFKGEL